MQIQSNATDQHYLLGCLEKMAEYIVKELIEQIIEKALENVAWDVYYMKIACLAALRSKDPSTPVSYNNNMVL